MLVMFLTAGSGAAQDKLLSEKSKSDLPSHSFALTLTNFIQFVKNPPEIDTLIYKRVLLNKSIAFETKAEAEKYIKDLKAGKIRDSKQEELFALKYLSSDHLVFQQITSAANAWSATNRIGAFFGRGEGIWWMLTPNGAMTTDSTNGTYKLGDDDLTAFVTHHKFATELLRIGMYDLLPTTIREAETSNQNSGEIRFTGRSEFGETISGAAVATMGSISKITYNILNSGSKIPGRVIDITHESGHLKSIKVSNLTAGRPEPVLYSYYEVLSLVMPTKPLPKSSCAVEQFMTKSDRRVLTKVNGESFFYSGDKLKPVPKVSGAGLKNNKSTVKTIIVLLLLISSVAPLVVWAINKKSRQPS